MKLQKLLVSTAFVLTLSVVSISASAYAQDTGLAFEENMIMPVYKNIQSIRRGESDQFYFRISGGRKANFAANGFVDTY